MVRESVPMSHTALAAVLGALGSFVADRQLALNVYYRPPEPELACADLECEACNCPAFDCAPCVPCPACPQFGGLEPAWIAGFVILVFVLGIFVGCACGERCCGFPQPRPRDGRSVIRRSAAGHAIAG